MRRKKEGVLMLLKNKPVFKNVKFLEPFVVTGLTSIYLPAEGLDVLAPDTLLRLINHFKGSQVLTPPAPGAVEDRVAVADLRDIKGQETAKRALEITAAGGHNLLTLFPIDRPSDWR